MKIMKTWETETRQRQYYRQCKEGEIKESRTGRGYTSSKTKRLGGSSEGNRRWEANKGGGKIKT